MKAEEALKPGKRKIGGSLAVAAGIMGSRLAGLVRQSVFAYYFGNTDAADVYNAGFKIPNLLQNLFGEGALSASFIPVYARLRAEGREKEADRAAWAVAFILAFFLSVAVLLGVLATPLIIGILAPGFTGAKREETIRLVQIFFPGAGLLVMSAWCLGVLNSHRKFFLAYAAPAVWSAAIVLSLVIFGRSESGYRLAEWAAWGSVAGSALQVLIQLPVVLPLLSRPERPDGGDWVNIREVLKNFAPVAVSRGVVQISAYVDQIIASFLPTGAVAALGYAQVVYMLPISLFGMSVSAAELPEMASQTGTDEEIAAALRKRLVKGLARIAFFVVPSAVLMALLGDAVANILFRRGRFGDADALYVWTILAGYSLGLLAATMGRLYSSCFYALKDTRSPLNFAVARVTLAGVLGWFSALMLPPVFGVHPMYGAAGLALSAGFAGWVEFFFLRRKLEKRIGDTRLKTGSLKPLWASAIVAGATALAVKIPFREEGLSVFSGSVLALTVYGSAYLVMTSRLGVEEAKEFTDRAKGFLKIK